MSEEPPKWLTDNIPSERPIRIKMVRQYLADYAKFNVRSLTEIEYVAWRMGTTMKDARRLVLEVYGSFD